MVEQMAATVLDGIEVWYPYSSDRSSEYVEITVDAIALADRQDLLKTGGSD